MFQLPKLDYSYEDLPGVFTAEQMRYHHGAHHQAYVDKLNQAIEANPDFSGMELNKLVVKGKDIPVIANNGGGHYNHSLFWNCMSPRGGGSPEGILAEIINKKYGSFESFVEKFSEAAINVFGSGWVFLQPNGEIITTQNQQTPMTLGLDEPILCLDVWEHAYYLDYKNKRADYISAWWKIVDWVKVEKRLG